MREFDEVLAWLRGLAWPCAPPIGVGEFEVLYASAVEVVVWYSPAREGHRVGEVAIPCARLAAAWARLVAGAALDEGALTDLGAGPAGGRWLLALLALLPGARVQSEPLMLTWTPEPEPAPRKTASRKRRRPTTETRPPVTPRRPARRVQRPVVARETSPTVTPRVAAPHEPEGYSGRPPYIHQRDTL
jgi:hypothetical protein